jgi:hypothetical protein
MRKTTWITALLGLIAASSAACGDTPTAPPPRPPIVAPVSSPEPRPPEPLPLTVLWGVVYEKTEAGRVPVAGVHVEDSNTHLSSKTDAEGRYRLDFTGIDRSWFPGVASLYIAKDGFNTMSRTVAVAGDTRLDIEAGRR